MAWTVMRGAGCGAGGTDRPRAMASTRAVVKLDVRAGRTIDGARFRLSA